MGTLALVPLLSVLQLVETVKRLSTRIVMIGPTTALDVLLDVSQGQRLVIYVPILIQIHPLALLLAETDRTILLSLQLTQSNVTMGI